MKRIIAAVAAVAACAAVQAQNPYLPLWEHIPDGEPYVFEDPDRPGHYRVYVYGSHDDLITAYCGQDQVVWSAPVEDLTAWRYDGVCFYNIDGGKADVLYAPDIVEVVEDGKKVYYFTPNVQNGGRQSLVAKGNRPDGLFKPCNWDESGKTTKGCFAFDPAIFRDDDGRIYGYWGFERSYAAELDPTTMSSPKPGTQIIEDMVSGRNQKGVFRFFEASSIRKVKGKYVFIYSRFTEDDEFGLPSSNNTLAYAYSDSPLGPWTYGGTIIDGRGRDRDRNGNVIATNYKFGNTHGSICEIGQQWWVFYHRHTGTDEYSRQAMVAPIDVKVTKDGRVVITEGEVTSEGFRTEGLNPLERTQSGWACYFTGPKPMTSEFPKFFHTGSYPMATHNKNSMLMTSFSQNNKYSFMINNTAGSTIGYKYYDMKQLAGREAEIELHLRPLGVAGEIVFMLDSPYESKGGTVIGRLTLTGNEKKEEQYLTAKVQGFKKGKHALYMLFQSDTKDKSLCDIYDFIFMKKD